MEQNKEVTCGIFFAGGGLFEEGMRLTNIPHSISFAIEKDPDIAQVWKNNHAGHMINKDIFDVDIDALPKVDYFHASPPCQSFSQTNPKSNPGETPTDLNFAAKIGIYLKGNFPYVFTLENVPAYQESESFELLVDELEKLNYACRWDVYHCSKYGVPQTRRRLVLIAWKMPLSLSFYSSLKDLISTHYFKSASRACWGDFLDPIKLGLEKSKPTTGQVTTCLRRKGLDKDLLILRYSNRCREKTKPAPTVLAGLGKGNRKKFADIWWAETQQWYALTPKEIAILQTVPLTYQLPNNNELALNIIGNGVPCEFAKVLTKPILEKIQELKLK